MPKKAVLIFFIAALAGAVIFVYFTFPRTREEIPTSNNQRPFPSAPEPVPNSVPVPETVPHPTTPKVPPGPSLRVMAWADADEAKALSALVDAFSNETGRTASVVIDKDLATYQRDVQEALTSAEPPDVCLVGARDFSGLNPAHDLVEVKPDPGAAPRSVAAFTINGHVMAAPDEYSVDILFYNPVYFDQAGIGYPDRHWNWDVLESITRALVSLHQKNSAGAPVYPLELAADFDLWNILCTQAGQPALDLDKWNLSNSAGKASQMRALDLIRELFHEYDITAPLPSDATAPGGRFAQEQAALLIAPSDRAATLPNFHYGVTLLPADIHRATLARVRGWAVTARAGDPDAARILADYLSRQPVHRGWLSVLKPEGTDPVAMICYEALNHALVPRIEPKSAPLAQYLDKQIGQLARDADLNTDSLYTSIQTQYNNGQSPGFFEDSLLPASATQPSPRVEGGGQLRGL